MHKCLESVNILSSFKKERGNSDTELNFLEFFAEEMRKFARKI